MRKIFVAVLLVLAGALAASAQGEWAKEAILEKPDRAGGVYALYPEGQPLPPAAPKGYKPFYVSHLGRHGSRYAIGSNVYTDVYEVWKTAHEKGNLTPEGERVYEAYADLYPRLRYHEGLLTQKGQRQHRQIASQLYRDYPAVFKGKTRAEVLSTTSHRVILSMMCFLDELKAKDPDFTYYVDYGRSYYPVLVPESSDNPDFVPRVPFPEETLKVYDDFARECIDEDAILGRWFASPDSLGAARSDFMYHLSSVVFDFCNLDFMVPEILTDLFTPDERYGLWRIQNYSDYLYTARAPGIDIRRCLEMSVTVKDFIEKFHLDVLDGVSMRLRFSHDTALMPLLSYLGVNGMDVVEADPRNLEKVWRNYNISMAGNLQIVFFRHRKKPDDILIQVLLNGTCATLPLPEAAPGFYRWNDFVARFDKLEI